MEERKFGNYFCAFPSHTPCGVAWWPFLFFLPKFYAHGAGQLTSIGAAVPVKHAVGRKRNRTSLHRAGPGANYENVSIFISLQVLRSGAAVAFEQNFETISPRRIVIRRSQQHLAGTDGEASEIVTLYVIALYASTGFGAPFLNFQQ